MPFVDSCRLPALSASPTCHTSSKAIIYGWLLIIIHKDYNLPAPPHENRFTTSISCVTLPQFNDPVQERVFKILIIKFLLNQDMVDSRERCIWNNVFALVWHD